MLLTRLFEPVFDKSPLTHDLCGLPVVENGEAFIPWLSHQERTAWSKNAGFCGIAHFICLMCSAIQCVYCWSSWSMNKAVTSQACTLQPPSTVTSQLSCEAIGALSVSSCKLLEWEFRTYFFDTVNIQDISKPLLLSFHLTAKLFASTGKKPRPETQLAMSPRPMWSKASSLHWPGMWRCWRKMFGNPEIKRWQWNINRYRTRFFSWQK